MHGIQHHASLLNTDRIDHLYQDRIDALESRVQRLNILSLPRPNRPLNRAGLRAAVRVQSLLTIRNASADFLSRIENEGLFQRCLDKGRTRLVS